MKQCAIRSLLCAVAVSCPAWQSVAPSREFLAIAASDRDPAAIAKKSAELARKGISGLILRTADCGAATNVFALSVYSGPERNEADAAVARVRPKVPDAYVRACEPRPNSLLALDIPAVDPSIAEVPEDAVNWDDTDRVSSVIPLAGGGRVALIRYFQQASNDPLEGRRTRVEFIGKERRRTVLKENCNDPGSVSALRERIVFDCASEQAGDEILHNTEVFDEGGRRVGGAERCRQPRWNSYTVAMCREEHVDSNGRLSLTDKLINLSQR